MSEVKKEELQHTELVAELNIPTRVSLDTGPPRQVQVGTHPTPPSSGSGMCCCVEALELCWVQGVKGRRDPVD